MDPDLGRARQPRPERGARRAPSTRLGIWGLPLATSIVNIAGTAALLVLLRRRLGRLDLTDNQALVRADPPGERRARLRLLRHLGRAPRRARRVVRRRARLVAHGDRRRRRYLPRRLQAARRARARHAALAAAPTRGVIEFRPLAEDDLPLVEEWLRRDHVARWWRDDIAESLAEYRAALEGREPTDHFMIVVDGCAIGMIQTYLVSDYPEWEEVVQVGDGRRRRRPDDRRGGADRPRARPADPRRVRARRRSPRACRRRHRRGAEPPLVARIREGRASGTSATSRRTASRTA